MKVCTRCDRLLPTSSFSRQAEKPMGLRSHCKQCIAASRLAITKKNKNTPARLTCGLCDETKGFERFAVDAGKNTGRKSYCLACQNAKERARIRTSRAAAVAKAGATRRSMKRNLEKRKAHVKVGNALRGRKLFKEPCMRCGETKVHAHHEDYQKPLDVVWLCPACHSDYHTGRWKPDQMPGPKP